MAAPDQITHWREKIFARLVQVVLVLGLATAIPSIAQSLREGLWGVVVVDLVALSWLAALWRLQEVVSYPLRAMQFLLITFAVGVALMLQVGPVAHTYLLAVPCLAALLVGLKPAVWLLLAGAVAIVLTGFAPAPDPAVMGLADDHAVRAAIVALNYLFIAGILTMSCGVLLRHLARSLAEGEQLAFYDPLTGLPNRRLLLDRLAGLLASSERQHVFSAVMFVDLDRFKTINDARGHATGDHLLRLAAQRLEEVVRKSDTVARIGGDEFVVLLAHLAPDLAAASSAAQGVAEKIRAALAQEFEIAGQGYGCSASIGVTLLPKHGQQADDLLREADTAMYRAKGAGRNGIAFFEAAMQSELERRLTLERELGQAIEQERLHVVYQPQFDCLGRLHGAELLMRWERDDGSMVAPAIFVPLAEEAGLIGPLGLWALKQACLAQQRMAVLGLSLPLSVNVSPQQFRQPDFVQQVRTILQEQGMEPALLILEVTEGLLVDRMDEIVARMNQLADLGVRFSIDDFGTGYSSLAYLKRMPLYELKIDRSFIMDMPDDASDVVIVQTILAMAGQMGLRVVAEGVETQAQADFLAAHGCHALQGYLLGRPAPLPALLDLLTAQAALSTKVQV
ncbi:MULTISPECIES: bifunctional diguanylate cyclase/phosphodiesterase [unclassified Duganella]|uniref:putative bifunctional diguanylate cyclase/phosphodiesterase n=1 Tax=unclassified Duganella TaxID=2636909 RepID=UPI0006F8567A|nr:MULTISPECIES: bifunctional diguanylate cyclase/phosphodiesterase [unclassified Duganella]KQV44836.1 diguanylate cyclase [Duganella sp. Root336D2]KRB83359.1 diguanylate cyclase [Duganella sp. Root198D2]